jgi:hypothetical protein
MFPGEYAVEMETSEAGKISLFASEEKVNTERSLVRVEVLQDNNGGGVTVCLPSSPFEISSRAVKVPRGSVIFE